MSKFDNRYNIKFDRYNVELRLRYGTIRNWSRSALDCYKRGCKCSGCFYYETYFKTNGLKCNMKASVLELIRRYGRPSKEEIEKAETAELEEDNDRTDTDS